MPKRWFRLTGGSKSDVWRQNSADIFNEEAVNMEIDEAASFGAAIQAMWCYAHYNGEKTPISGFTDAFVKLKEGTRKSPDKESAAKYDELFNMQTKMSIALRKVFDIHKKIVSKN